MIIIHLFNQLFYYNYQLNERSRNSTIYTINFNICYFLLFLIRPQQKRVKEHKAMVEVLKRGDEIITSGGIIGIVERVMEDDRIEVNIGNDIKGSNN